MKKKSILSFGLTVAIFLCCGAAQAENPVLQLKSPSGNVRVAIENIGGRLTYSLSYRGTTLLGSSSLAWSLNGDTLGQNVTKMEAGKSLRVKSDYPIRGAHSHVTTSCNSTTLELTEKGGRQYSLTFRLYDTGIAFRYRAKSSDSVRVDDYTTFAIPAGVTLWSQPKTDCYEGKYQKSTAGSLTPGTMAGPPVTLCYEGGLYAAITEAGLVNFGGMGLKAVTSSEWQASLTGSTLLCGEIETPWRVVMAGDLNSLVNNDIISDVSAPLSPIFKGDTGWIETGNCVWSWLAGYKVTLDDMKRFTDWAAQLHIPYNLVDEGWSYWNGGGEAAWEALGELTAYAKKKGVKTLLWKAYPNRGGVEGIQTPELRHAFFEKCLKYGIAGAKIDFFDRESQTVTRYYAETLREAASMGLIINFHGANKPTGLERTYPNEVTREGIRGLENGGSDALRDAVLPFTRYLAGHADYTPFTLLPRLMVNTTEAHQMASTVLFFSPLRCLGGRPEDFLAHKARSIFMSVPTLWDETRVLSPSEPGVCAIMARRNADTWFVGGYTVMAQRIELPLSFLGKGTYSASIVRDGKEKDCIVEEQMVNRKTVLTLPSNDGGGFLLRFVPVKKK